MILAEALLLALAGGAVGTVIAVEGLDLLRVLVADKVPRLVGAGRNPRVLAFTAAASIAVALLAGLRNPPRRPLPRR